MPIHYTCQPELFTFEDNSNKENQGSLNFNSLIYLDTSTGSSFVTPQRRFALPQSRRSLEMRPMLNSQGQQQLWSTSGRMRQPLLEQGSSLVSDPWIEVNLRIGTKLEFWLNQVNLMQSQQMCMLDVTSHSRESAAIIFNLLPLKEKFIVSGVSQEVASLEGPGQKQVWTLSQRIQTQSSGMGIAIRNMLSSMSFVELSPSVTCSDGWIVIPLLLKLKAAQLYCQQKESGLLPISIQESGTQIWIPVPLMPSSEGYRSPISRSRTPRPPSSPLTPLPQRLWNSYSGYDNL